MEDYHNAVMVTNDAFVKAFMNLKQFDLNDTEHILEMRFRGWLRRITVNASLDQLRINKRTVDFDMLEDAHWDISDKTGYADSKFLYKELICYLKELPPAYQKVFNLYVIDGYSHTEIAELLGVSISSSKSNLFRAKEFLQKRISEFFETKKI
jgi:RNA polymerase sigma-70 factor (ECF subfamily)